MPVITLLPIINVKIRGSSEAAGRRKNNQSTATNFSSCLSARRFFHTFSGIFPSQETLLSVFVLSVFVPLQHYTSWNYVRAVARGRGKKYQWWLYLHCQSRDISVFLP